PGTAPRRRLGPRVGRGWGSSASPASRSRRTAVGTGTCAQNRRSNGLGLSGGGADAGGGGKLGLGLGRTCGRPLEALAPTLGGAAAGAPASSDSGSFPGASGFSAADSAGRGGAKLASRWPFAAAPGIGLGASGEAWASSSAAARPSGGGVGPVASPIA